MLLFNLLVAIAALWLAFLYLRYRKWLTETHYYLPPSVNFIEGTVGEFVRAKSSGQVLDILLRGVRAGSSVSQLIFPLGIHRALILYDADWIDYITTNNMAKPGRIYKNIRFIPEAESIIDILDNEEWRRIRRQVAHAFAPTSLKHQTPVLVKTLGKWLDRLHSVAGSPEYLDFDQEFTKVTFDYIAESAFGVELNMVENSEGEHNSFIVSVTKVLHGMNDRSLNPWKKWIPNEGMRQFKKDLDRVTQIGKRILAEAELAKDQETDQRRTSIWAAVNGIENISDRNRLANFFVFVIAGHDTTAHGMAFTMFNLLTHPEELKLAVAEVDSVLGDSHRIAEHAQIAQFPYLMACFKESLRMYPPVGGVGRVIDETKTINGLTLEKGQEVILSCFSLHYNERYWKEPNRFRPARFLNKEEDQARHKASFIPFSIGPRDCIGKVFAMNEAMIVLSALLKHFTFELSPSYKIGIDPGTTNRPFGGMPIKISLR